MMKEWTAENAVDFYNIQEWGNGYFTVDSAGDVAVRIKKENENTREVALTSIVNRIKESGLQCPVLLRFDDILQGRVEALHRAFQAAREKANYHSRYISVYPIKVNQRRRVVEQLLSSNVSDVGLESGSKAEFMAVLSLIKQPGQLIICNGYKDEQYIRLCLLARKLGHNVYIIVEKLSEIAHIIKQAKQMDVAPLLGIRVRLSSIGKGKWQNSGGEKSKFGLTCAGMLIACEQLKAAGLRDGIQMLHFHLGSQVANIHDMRAGLREAARFYAELRRLGMPLRYVDVGGGLGVDYEGTRSRSFCSINYSIQEYANTITAVFAEICGLHGLAQPVLITEAGRAMTAHHAVLITEVIDTEARDDELTLSIAQNNQPSIIQELIARKAALNPRNLIETYHTVCELMHEAQGAFCHGILNLSERAAAEELYQQICTQIQQMGDPAAKPQREILDEINDKLADKLFCNFSLFRSIPDVWAIDQIFPVLPLSGLTALPERRAVIQDITCDSDGRIDYYVESQGVQTTLALPSVVSNGPLYLGVFLVGAYQEILGDIHNLFGDTHSVHVQVDADGELRFSEVLPGETIADLLSQVQFQVEDLLQSYHEQCAGANLDADQHEQLMNELKETLASYSYLK